MILTSIIFVLTISILIWMVMFKPKLYFGRFSVESFWVVAVIGAGLLLSLNLVTPRAVYNGLTVSIGMNPLKLLIIFLSMSGLSVMLDELGFFKKVSMYVLSKANKSQRKIFIYLYLTVSVLTIFTSNDIIILTFTPIIIYFSKHAKINPVPLLISEFVAANTWSLMLMIGNPTNMYLASSFNIDFFEYLSVMWLPTIITGLFTFGLLYVVFRKELSKPVMQKTSEPVYLENRFLVISTLIHLILSTILLTISSYIQIEMYLIALVFLLSNSLIMVIYQIFYLQEHPAYFMNTVKRMPWNLMPFVIAMFIMVISLNTYGITQKFNHVLSYLDPLFGYGITSFLSANIINNIPMSVLYADIIGFMNQGMDTSLKAAIYSSIIGSNIGAYLTPIGALAGMMWMRILKKEAVELSFKRFIYYGLIIALPTILVALIVLQLII